MKRLVIAGASGVVGRHLVAKAKTTYDVTVLTRKVDGSEPAEAAAVAWNPRAAKEKDKASLSALAEVLGGADALVNLAGASIAAGRLDDEHKQRVLQSRVDSTETLVEAFKQTSTELPVWFQASAVGYYGDRGDEILDEQSSSQDGSFLSQVATEWEGAAEAVKADTRLVIGRLGLVLAKDAEAWQKMLMPIKLFVGGPLGSGQQWFAWIDADDLASAILFLIDCETCEGVYNLTAPEPVRQKELAQKTAEKLGRPAFIPAPSFALKLALGEVADALLLTSARVLPKRLLETEFSFENSTIEEELSKLL